MWQIEGTLITLLLNCQHVEFRYPGIDDPSLRDISLSTHKGKWLSLVGPSGCGKSALLHCIAGLNHYRNDIEIASTCPQNTPHHKLTQRITFIPQRLIIPEGLRIRGYVTLSRTPYHSHNGEIIDVVVARLSLATYTQYTLSDVSDDELQRIVLTRTLVQGPEVLLLDEPTSALDIGVAQQVVELVDNIRHELGLTIIAVVYDLTLVDQYSGRTTLLATGQLVCSGTSDEVLTGTIIKEVYGAAVQITEMDAPVVIP